MTRHAQTARRDDAALLLDARTRRLPGLSYKLAPAQAGRYGYDVAFTEPDVDEARMCVRFPFADGQRRDGVGDLLEVTGIRTERHKKNPVVLYDHGKSYSLPVGLAEDPESREYTVFIDAVEKCAWVRAFFYQGRPGESAGAAADPARLNEHALFCEQLFDLIARKYIRAGSIGYQVIKAASLAPDYERGIPQGLHLQQVLMLEASVVVMPCNMDSVMKALSLPTVCGRRLSPYLAKSLAQYAPPRKAWLGYEGKAAPGGNRRARQPLPEPRPPRVGDWVDVGTPETDRRDARILAGGRLTDLNEREAAVKPPHLEGTPWGYTYYPDDILSHSENTPTESERDPEKGKGLKAGPRLSKVDEARRLIAERSRRYDEAVQDDYRARETPGRDPAADDAKARQNLRKLHREYRRRRAEAGLTDEEMMAAHRPPPGYEPEPGEKSQGGMNRQSRLAAIRGRERRGYGERRGAGGPRKVQDDVDRVAKAADRELAREGADWGEAEEADWANRRARDAEVDEKSGPPVERRLRRDEELARARWAHARDQGADDETMSRLSGEVSQAIRRRAHASHNYPEHMRQHRVARHAYVEGAAREGKAAPGGNRRARQPLPEPRPPRVGDWVDVGTPETDERDGTIYGSGYLEELEGDQAVVRRPGSRYQQFYHPSEIVSHSENAPTRTERDPQKGKSVKALRLKYRKKAQEFPRERSRIIDRDKWGIDAVNTMRRLGEPGNYQPDPPGVRGTEGYGNPPYLPPYDYGDDLEPNVSDAELDRQAWEGYERPGKGLRRAARAGKKEIHVNPVPPYEGPELDMIQDAEAGDEDARRALEASNQEKKRKYELRAHGTQHYRYGSPRQLHGSNWGTHHSQESARAAAERSRDAYDRLLKHPSATPAQIVDNTKPRKKSQGREEARPQPPARPAPARPINPRGRYRHERQLDRQVARSRPEKGKGMDDPRNDPNKLAEGYQSRPYQSGDGRYMVHMQSNRPGGRSFDYGTFPSHEEARDYARRMAAADRSVYDIANTALETDPETGQDREIKSALGGRAKPARLPRGGPRRGPQPAAAERAREESFEQGLREAGAGMGRHRDIVITEDDESPGDHRPVKSVKALRLKYRRKEIHINPVPPYEGPELDMIQDAEAGDAEAERALEASSQEKKRQYQLMARGTTHFRPPSEPYTYPTQGGKWGSYSDQQSAQADAETIRANYDRIKHPEATPAVVVDNTRPRKKSTWDADSPHRPKVGDYAEIGYIGQDYDEHSQVHPHGRLTAENADGSYRFEQDWLPGNDINVKPEEILSHSKLPRSPSDRGPHKGKGLKARPSDDISPEKARQILRDGEAHGRPLTDRQRGMFGAAAGKSVKDLRAKYRAGPAAADGRRRHVKRAKAGSCVICVDLDRLADAEAAARDGGVEARRLGAARDGSEKVRLTGDGAAMDAVAAQYGKPADRYGRPVAAPNQNPSGGR